MAPPILQAPAFTNEIAARAAMEAVLWPKVLSVLVVALWISSAT